MLLAEVISATAVHSCENLKFKENFFHLLPVFEKQKSTLADMYPEAYH